MFLFFDVVANGLPKRWNAPASDVFSWPRLVQIAWQVYDNHGKVLAVEDFLIKPEGFKISGDTESITGITNELAETEGHDLKEVLVKFKETIDESKYIIAHNFTADGNVVGAEFVRKSMEHKHNLFVNDSFSLMAESTYFCKLPGKNGKYKWPSQQELHQKLFGHKFADAHNAKVDVQATANCFFKLIELEAIDLF